MFVGQNKMHGVMMGDRGLRWGLSTSWWCLCDIGCSALEAVGWLELWSD